MAYIGEIRAMPYTYTPVTDVRWLLCDGAIYSTHTYPALFAIIGYRFGGDGRTKFAVPDLRSRITVGAGTPPFTTKTRNIGDKWGDEKVALNPTQVPWHNHTLQTAITASAADLDNKPDPKYHVSRTYNQWDYGVGQATNFLDAHAVGSAGGDAKGNATPHENRQPVTAIPYFICYDGLFPQRE